MPETTDSTGLEAIMARGAEAAEKFQQDSRAMDAAWKNGTLDEWLKAHLAQELEQASVE